MGLTLCPGTGWAVSTSVQGTGHMVAGRHVVADSTFLVDCNHFYFQKVWFGTSLLHMRRELTEISLKKEEKKGFSCSQ